MKANFFSEEELCCKCCGVNGTTQRLRDVLDNIRLDMGSPVYLNSAYRCEKHNESIGGAKYSPHKLGEGADIRTENSRARWLVVAAAIRCGVDRIGVGDNFVHVDVSKSDKHIPGLIWHYYK